MSQITFTTRQKNNHRDQEAGAKRNDGGIFLCGIECQEVRACVSTP